MLAAAILAVSILAQAPQASAGRYEMAERLKGVDQAWNRIADKTRRAAAAPKITKAMAAFNGGNPGEACRALDDASAVLNGRESRSEDAISLRFEPPFAEPKTAARLRINWAYIPKGATPVRITVGKQTIVATPGRSLTMTVSGEVLNPEAVMTPEIGYVVPVQVGGSQKGVYLSIVKRFRERLAPLVASTDPEVRTLALAVQQQINNPRSVETDIPLIQHLFTAELLNEGRLKLDSVDELPLVTQDGTFFRIAFPASTQGARGRTNPVTVVLAVPATGGSENTFFDSYGAGKAVAEAIKRDWIFVNVRPGAKAIENALTWLQTRRGLKIARLFLVGHAAGADQALAFPDSPRPTALALLAPIQTALPTTLGDTPLYLAVTKSDPTTPKSFIALVSDRKGSQAEEFDPATHQMLPADALVDAFRFFDSKAK